LILAGDQSPKKTGVALPRRGSLGEEEGKKKDKARAKKSRVVNGSNHSHGRARKNGYSTQKLIGRSLDCWAGEEEKQPRPPILGVNPFPSGSVREEGIIPDEARKGRGGRAETF